RVVQPDGVEHGGVAAVGPGRAGEVEYGRDLVDRQRRVQAERVLDAAEDGADAVGRRWLGPVADEPDDLGPGGEQPARHPRTEEPGAAGDQDPPVVPAER